MVGVMKLDVTARGKKSDGAPRRSYAEAVAGQPARDEPSEEDEEPAQAVAPAVIEGPEPSVIRPYTPVSLW